MKNTIVVRSGIYGFYLTMRLDPQTGESCNARNSARERLFVINGKCRVISCDDRKLVLSVRQKGRRKNGGVSFHNVDYSLQGQNNAKRIVIMGEGLEVSVH